MGTSTSNRGQNGKTPLVPSWLNDDENNGKQIGDIVYYKLEKDYNSFFFLDKKIVIDKSVILGSYL